MDWVFNAYTAVVAALLAALGFLIRKIFTSEQKIAVLEAQLNMISEDIHELRTDVKDLLGRD